MRQPLLTVVVTSYNYAHYITTCVESILSQDFADFELIVLDNCSTDDTLSVLAPYLADPRMRIVCHERNLSSYVNFNLAVREGSGRYLAIVSADDYVLPGYFSRLITALQNNPSCVLAYTPIVNVDKDGIESGVQQHVGYAPAAYQGGRNDFVHLLTHDCYVTLCAVILDRVQLASDLYFEINAWGGADWEFFVRVALKYQHFVYDPTPGAAYRSHASQYSRTHFYASLEPLYTHLEILQMYASEIARRSADVPAIINLLSQRIGQYPAASIEPLRPRINTVLRRLQPGGASPASNGRVLAAVVAGQAADGVTQQIERVQRGLGQGCAAVLPFDGDAAGLLQLNQTLESADEEFSLLVNSQPLVEGAQFVRAVEFLVANPDVSAVCIHTSPASTDFAAFTVETSESVVGVLCRTAVVQALGGLSPVMFAGGALWDLSLRLLRFGKGVVGLSGGAGSATNNAQWVRAQVCFKNPFNFTNPALISAAQTLLDDKEQWGDGIYDVLQLQPACSAANYFKLLSPVGPVLKPVLPDEATPFFSIILTTYNRADLLVDALASLAAQTFKSFEVILINDAGAPVEHVLQGYDFPITYLALGKNGGLSNARNCGIRQARGVNLCYLDDDDMWLPQHLERHAQAHAQGARLVYTDTLYVLESLEGGTRRELSRQSSVVHSDFSRADLLVQNFIPVNAWSHPRQWLDEVGGFDVELPALEDWDMLLKLSARYPVEHVAEHTVQVHIRQESPEQRMSVRERKNFPALFRRLYGRHGQGVEPVVAQARGAFLQSLDDEMNNKAVGQPSVSYLHTLTPQVFAAFERRLQGEHVPTLEVLVLALPGTDDAAVLQTLDSLASQQYGAAHRVVQGDWQQVNDAALNSAADWLYLLPAGDRLESHALAVWVDRVLGAPAGCYYADEDSLGEQGPHAPIFKPDFNLDLLRSYPYTGRSLCVSREALEQLGGLRTQFEGLAVQDFQLRCVESFGLDSVGHIAEVLSHSALPFAQWLASDEVRQHSATVVGEHLDRLGVPHTLQEGALPGFNRIRYNYPEQPLVSILVPTKDQLPLLQRCVETLLEKTAYTNFELLIIDNASETEEAKTWLAGIEQLNSEQIRVVRYPGPFNFSAINNAAAAQAKGEYLVLLNNDTAILREDWLDELLNHARRPEVGIVGAKLLFPSGHIQHAGVVLGLSGPADHPFLGDAGDSAGYMHRLLVDQNYSAVTAACLIIRKEVYDAVGGLDEVAFKVSYNDVDLCLKVREAGYLSVWTPYSVLLHEGSVSQKSGVETLAQEQKLKRFRSEQAAMYQKWMPLLARDPAYNVNLTLANKGFELDPIRGAVWQPFVQAPLPRILAHPADQTGCGHYRVRQPFTAMQRDGLADGVISETLMMPVELARFQADVLILQRQVTDAQLEAIAEIKQFSGAFRVYELDDYLPNLPLKSVHRADMPKDVLRSLRRALTLSDRFVVSTQPLAEALAGMHPDIRVAPNRLPTNWWNGLNSKRRVGRKPRVGWAGGVGHTGDLELIVDVVRDLADEVEWVFFGLCPEKVRPYVAEFYPGVTIDKYPAILASLNLDLALAPLEQNQFNDCKSNLRLLEYGFLGFPVICSDAVCYRGDLPATRVKNRYKDWVDAVRMHLSDMDATAKMGNELQAIVRRDWMLDGANVENWLNAWLPD